FYRALAYGKSAANAHDQGLAALGLPMGGGRVRDIVPLVGGQCATSPKLFARPGIANHTYIAGPRSKRERRPLQPDGKDNVVRVVRAVSNQQHGLRNDEAYSSLAIEGGLHELTIDSRPRNLDFGVVVGVEDYPHFQSLFGAADDARD